MTLIESESLLSTTYSNESWHPTPKHILKIAIRVKHLIDTIIPIELAESELLRPDSVIISPKALHLCLEACGGKGGFEEGSSARKYQAVVVFVLLHCQRWYRQSRFKILYDAGLYKLREVAAAQLAKRAIEHFEALDERYLFKEVLTQRYSITLHGVDAEPQSAFELAADLHSILVLGSSGYQRCVKWVWRGWIVQSDTSGSTFIFDKSVDETSFWAHFDPDRIKAPVYQNHMNLFSAFVYLLFYTISINSLWSLRDIDVSEYIFYIFTIGYAWDEIRKFYHVGFPGFGFWNAFNCALYALGTVAMVFRVLAKTGSVDHRMSYDESALRILSCCAPLVWGRILLYMESFPFFGAMLIIVKELMSETIIFFVLLIVIGLSFLQAFMGLDTSDGSRDLTMLLAKVMTRTVLTETDFDLFDLFAPPYGEVLYYIFTFLITTILLNILIALFNSAYEKIYENATDEYMALVAQKTLRYTRAPDEKVFVAPFNLIELVFLTIPLSWIMDKRQFAMLNDVLLTILFSPALALIAWYESGVARVVKYNRRRSLPDDSNEEDEEWDLLDGYHDESAPGYRDELQQLDDFIAHGDPDFAIDEDLWTKEVLMAAPRVDEAQKNGVNWETVAIINKIDEAKFAAEGNSDGQLKAEQASQDLGASQTSAASAASATSTNYDVLKGKYRDLVRQYHELKVAHDKLAGSK